MTEKIYTLPIKKIENDINDRGWGEYSMMKEGGAGGYSVGKIIEELKTSQGLYEKK